MHTHGKALCKSIQRGSNVFQVKLVLMGRFVVCVGCIVCGGQGRDIFYFFDQNTDDRKDVRTLEMT